MGVHFLQKALSIHGLDLAAYLSNHKIPAATNFVGGKVQQVEQVWKIRCFWEVDIIGCRITCFMKCNNSVISRKLCHIRIPISHVRISHKNLNWFCDHISCETIPITGLIEPAVAQAVCEPVEAQSSVQPVEARRELRSFKHWVLPHQHCVILHQLMWFWMRKLVLQQEAHKKQNHSEELRLSWT